MKRGRVDGGVSKEQYEAAAMGFGSAGQDAFTGESSRASDLVLQTRKIYTKVTTRAQASQRQFAALNSGFVAAVQAQWRHNRQGDWTENMREYLAYARDAEATFGESEGQVRTGFDPMIRGWHGAALTRMSVVALDHDVWQR